MQKLHLVGFTKDHEGLILSARRGARSGGYLLTIDGALEEAVDDLRVRRAEEIEEGGVEVEAPRRPRVESALSVREIQARLRQGRTVAEVARAAGVDTEWVERFAPPVLAERAQVIAKVLGVPLRRARLGPSALPIGDAVRRNLADRGVAMTAEELGEAWTARQVGEGRWAVRCSFRYRGRDQTLRFDLDESTGEVSTADRQSGQLGYVTPPPRPAPKPERPRVSTDDAEERPTAKRAVVSTGFRPDPVVKPVSRSAKERERAAAAMRKAAAQRAVEGERAAARKLKERRAEEARRLRAEEVAAARAEREAQAAARRAEMERAKADKARAAERASARKEAATKRAAAAKSASATKKATAAAKATKKAAAKRTAATKVTAKAKTKKTAAAARATKKAAAKRTTPAKTTKKATRATAAPKKAPKKVAQPTKGKAPTPATPKRAAPAKSPATRSASRPAPASAPATRAASTPAAPTRTGSTSPAATAYRSTTTSAAPRRPVTPAAIDRPAPTAAPRAAGPDPRSEGRSNGPDTPTRTLRGSETRPDPAPRPAPRPTGPDRWTPPIPALHPTPGRSSDRGPDPTPDIRVFRAEPSEDGAGNGVRITGPAANVYGTESARAQFRRGLVEQASGELPAARAPEPPANVEVPGRAPVARPRRTRPLRAN